MESIEQIIAMPLIGDKATEFKVITTQGEVIFPVDYRRLMGDTL